MHFLKTWLPPVLWASLIFYMSSRQSLPVSGPLWVDFIVKKTAHVTEYAMFFVLLHRAFLTKTRNKAALLSFLVVLLYAASDEYHQSFVPTRHPAIRDVGFDAFGGILAWITIWNIIPKMPKKLIGWAKTLEII